MHPSRDEAPSSHGGHGGSRDRRPSEHGFCEPPSHDPICEAQDRRRQSVSSSSEDVCEVAVKAGLRLLAWTPFTPLT